jgi:hypothetical protein
MLTVALGAFTAALAAAGASYNIWQLRQGPGGRRRHMAWRWLWLQVVGVFVGVLVAVAGYRPGLTFWLIPVTWAVIAAQMGWAVRLRMSHS